MFKDIYMCNRQLLLGQPNMMKTKSILSDYMIIVHRWLKKVWSFIAISMWKKSWQKFVRKIFVFDMRTDIFIFLKHIFQFWGQILKEHTLK